MFSKNFIFLILFDGFLAKYTLKWLYIIGQFNATLFPFLLNFPSIFDHFCRIFLQFLVLSDIRDSFFPPWMDSVLCGNKNIFSCDLFRIVIIIMYIILFRKYWTLFSCKSHLVHHFLHHFPCVCISGQPAPNLTRKVPCFSYF